MIAQNGQLPILGNVCLCFLLYLCTQIGLLTLNTKFYAKKEYRFPAGIACVGTVGCRMHRHTGRLYAQLCARRRGNQLYEGDRRDAGASFDAECAADGRPHDMVGQSALRAQRRRDGDCLQYVQERQAECLRAVARRAGRLDAAHLPHAGERCLFLARRADAVLQRDHGQLQPPLPDGCRAGDGGAAGVAGEHARLRSALFARRQAYLLRAGRRRELFDMEL